MNFKFGVIKKNQILASMVVLMLVVAGYLNYTYDPTKNYDVELTGVMSNNLGDAYLVENTGIYSNIDEVEEKIEATAKVTTSNEYFASTRMERENSFSEQLEMYKNILSNNSISDEQKKFAQEEIARINNTKNAIIIAENLIKLKGFADAIILVNEDSVNVIVQAESLFESDVTQIQSIVMGELKVDAKKLHIRSI